MRNLFQRSWFVLVLTLMLAPVALPQQDQSQSQDQQQQQQGQNGQSSDQPAQPISAYHSPLSGLSGNQDQNQNPSGLQPDTHPLAGAQNLGLGTVPSERSYWQPMLSVFSTLDSNAFGLSSGWVTYTSLLGALEVHRLSARNDLTLHYAGGGTITTNSAVGNSVLQELELGDTVSLRRTTLSFFDTAAYIPETSFGFGGLGGLSLPGSGSLGLGYGYVPQESILAARDQRISNVAIGQMNYLLSPRASLTFLGGYSLLHFYGSGYLDIRQPMLQAGYNYQMTPRDTVAVLYRFSDYQFNGLNESIRDNRANLSYGRRVTGRIAFQIQAGPEIVTFQTPSSGTGTGPAGSSSPKYLWNLDSSLSYALERGGLGLSYMHGVNAGSGVLVGAVADTVGVTANRALSRQFNGGLRFGYARNSSLNGPTQLFTNRNYDYWYGGADLNHPFGRYLSLVISYQFQRETSNSPLCIGSSCGTFSRNTISVGFTWQDHPFAF